MSNKCEICYDTNMDYCITQEELDKALEGMLSKDELRYYTTEEQVDMMLEAAQIQTENKVARNYYNKGEIDTIVEALPTKQWVRSQGYVNESDVKDIVDESIDAADINIDLSDYYTKAQVDKKIAEIGEVDIDLEGYVTETEMKDAIEDAVNEIDLTEFVTEGEMNTAISDAISNIEGGNIELEGYATQQWVQDQNYITATVLTNACYTKSQSKNVIEQPIFLMINQSGESQFTVDNAPNVTYDQNGVAAIISRLSSRTTTSSPIGNPFEFKLLYRWYSYYYECYSIYYPFKLERNDNDETLYAWFELPDGVNVIRYTLTVGTESNAVPQYEITKRTYTATEIDDLVGDINSILNNVLYEL